MKSLKCLLDVSRAIQSQGARSLPSASGLRLYATQNEAPNPSDSFTKPLADKTEAELAEAVRKTAHASPATDDDDMVDVRCSMPPVALPRPSASQAKRDCQGERARLTLLHAWLASQLPGSKQALNSSVYEHLWCGMGLLCFCMCTVACVESRPRVKPLLNADSQCGDG